MYILSYVCIFISSLYSAIFCQVKHELSIERWGTRKRSGRDSTWSGAHIAIAELEGRREGASEPIITIDNKAFVLIIEGIIWPNVRGTCPHFSLNSPCSRNSWWGHSKGIRKPQHFTRFSTKVPFHKILSGNNLYYCSFNVVETSTLELQKRLTVFNGWSQAMIRLFWEYSKALRCTFFGEWKNSCISKFVQLELLNKAKARSSKNRAA